MLDSRRDFFLALAGAAGSAAILSRFAVAQQPPMGQSPPRSQSQAGPPPAIPEPPKRDPKKVLQEDEKDVKKNVARLFELASQLKDEVEKTDGTAVLSLGMLKKTEEIEKLARQIRNRAKGE
jgi:hypothetical protein